MITVSIIGSGNVAQHLISAFKKANGVKLVQVYARKPESVIKLVDSNQIISDYSNLCEVDLYILAVSDVSIAEVSRQIPFQNKIIAHTSGSIGMNALSNNHKAVFYPLQTFTKSKTVDFKTIPVCLESEHPNDFKIIEQAAKSISDVVYTIASEQRKALHVAAVFANNFANHMYRIGEDICKEHRLPFEILIPLIRETTAKIMVLSPAQAQTGPAKRNDIQTIESHVKFLKDPNQKALYTLLTQSIQNHE